jgi:hypothetical protein
MKSRTIFAFAALMIVLFAGVTAHAQPGDSRYARYDFQKLMKSFDASLRSDCPGIFESTIYNLALLAFRQYIPAATLPIT